MKQVVVSCLTASKVHFYGLDGVVGGWPQGEDETGPWILEMEDEAFEYLEILDQNLEAAINQDLDSRQGINHPEMDQDELDAYVADMERGIDEGEFEVIELTEEQAKAVLDLLQVPADDPIRRGTPQ